MRVILLPKDPPSDSILTCSCPRCEGSVFPTANSVLNSPFSVSIAKCAARHRTHHLLPTLHTIYPLTNGLLAFITSGILRSLLSQKIKFFPGKAIVKGGSTSRGR